MKGAKIEYSALELKYIETNCTLTRRELTSRFNAKFERSLKVENIASLCKRKGWLTGRDGRFQKGNIPSPNARPGGPNKTSFKKGNTPKNTLPIGAEVVSSDGYIKMKVAEPNEWEWKHRMTWEKAHGEIPEGSTIQFKDGDRLNCAIENLHLLTRAESLYLNQNKYSEMPDEVKPAMVAVAKLTTKAFSRAKEV